MRNILGDVLKRDKKGFVTILLLNIAVSMTGGISIVMLIPMLGLLDISQASVSALSVLAAPLQKLSYSAQVCTMIGLYFVLVVFKALLGRVLSMRESRFLEDYSYDLRDSLYRTVANADWEKLAASRQWEFVSRLKEGLDTTLGDQGVRLSGGERQRIVLARVLLGHPRLIIMDEATSSMDFESETAVRQAIRALHSDMTVLIIAHRLATVRTAQNAIVLEKGTITQAGALSELLARPEGYLHRLLYVE